MTAHQWVDDDNAALLTDLYQLTMLQAYFEEQMQEEAVFDLFIRRLKNRNFLLAAGLDTVLHYLETVHFTDESLDYLASLGHFNEAFLDDLADFRFTGSVYAMPEGTPFFANESVLQVLAPIGQAQLIETFLLNQITFQTGVASKACRVVHAAQGRLVADFGARRMHGADATTRGARAYHIAGIDSTSNVLAGKMYGLNVTGTMAHSYIEAHLSEEEAFEPFARLYEDTTLLVDTYDTLRGVEKVVELSKRLGDAFRIGAVRLDSGNLAELARDSRKILNEGGLEQVRIFASGSLDEYKIEKLLSEDAPIDGFGVGTSMGTMADQPYLDSAYKLAAYAGTPRMKLSTAKANLPGLKQIYRYYDRNGKATHDIIARMDEELDGEPILKCVMRDGQRTDEGKDTLDEARERARTNIDALPPQLLSLEKIEPEYEVRLSDRLRQTVEDVRSRLEQRVRDEA